MAKKDAPKGHGYAHGIPLKKLYGQHFLREQHFVDHMIDAVELTPESSIFEVGCGDGFLTKTILEQRCKQLWVFEIDSQWAEHVKKTYPDERLTIFTENILDVDFSRFHDGKPWTLLANLPYQISFPFLYLLARQRHLIKEGVVMIQEEVAQKILKNSGRGYGFPALYLQYHFAWRLLDKVPPTAFYPAPKVVSRLVYFKPIDAAPIKQEQEFWAFVKRCFLQPRRTLKNNLQSFHYDLNKISEDILSLRAQQLSMSQLLDLWDKVSP